MNEVTTRPYKTGERAICLMVFPIWWLIRTAQLSICVTRHVWELALHLAFGTLLVPVVLRKRSEAVHITQSGITRTALWSRPKATAWADVVQVVVKEEHSSFGLTRPAVITLRFRSGEKLQFSSDLPDYTAIISALRNGIPDGVAGREMLVDTNET